MKNSKYFFIFAGCVFLILTFAVGSATVALYRNVDNNGPSIAAEVKVLTTLATLQERLREVKSLEAAGQILKAIESPLSFGLNQERIKDIRQAYAPLLRHLKDRPKEADGKASLIRKKDFLDASLSFYRKEIPSGDIQVRAVILNVIFDIHNSFLSDAKEMEQVFIKKSRERLNDLKAIVSEAKSPGINYRISSLENLLGSYERQMTQIWAWEEKRLEILSEADQSSASLIKAVKASSEAESGAAKREFLETFGLSCILVIIALFVLLFGYFHTERRMRWRMTTFKKYFELFGKERGNAVDLIDVARLKNDRDWSALFVALEKAELDFALAFEAQRCVSHYAAVPFLVLNRSGEMVYANNGLSILTHRGVEEFLRKDMKEFFKKENWGRAGDNGVSQINHILSVIDSGGSCETQFRRGEEIVPVELVVSVIPEGKNLADGRVVFIREIPNEANRIFKAVTKQFQWINRALDGVLAEKPVSLNDVENGSETPELEAKKIVSRVVEFRCGQEEREAVRDSEAQTLLEQVTRQREILQKLSQELRRQKSDQARIQASVAKMIEVEQIASVEFGSVEQGLKGLETHQSRLSKEITYQHGLNERARILERELRDNFVVISQHFEVLKKHAADLSSVKEEVRLKALNLSLGREPGSEQFASRVRATCIELEKYCQSFDQIFGYLENFITSSPLHSSLPVLENRANEDELLANIHKERQQILYSIMRCKSDAERILLERPEMEKTLGELMQENDDLTRLSETCLLISQRAHENLVRSGVRQH